MSSWSGRTAANGDDGRATPSENFTNSLNPHFGDNGPDKRTAWFRFPSVNVAQGVTITSATITLTENGASGGTTALGTIYAIDEDDHTAPAGLASFDTDEGMHTTASVNWSLSTSTSPATSPDIKTVIQEIIDRGGWAANQAIGIHIDDNGSSDDNYYTCEDREDGSTKGALLSIEYTVPVDDTATPGTVTTSVTVPAPTLHAGSGTAPATVSASVTIPAPTLSYGTGTAPATVSATVTIPAPTISGEIRGTATPATVAVSVAIDAPAAISRTGTAPATVAASAAIPAPTLHAGSGAAPATVTATVAMYSPDISYGGLISPATVAAAAAIPAPAIAYGGLIAPAAVTASVTVPAPTLHAGSGTAPGTVVTNVAFPAPTLHAGWEVFPATVSATVTVLTPASIVAGVAFMWELFIAQATQVERIDAAATQIEQFLGPGGGT